MRAPVQSSAIRWSSPGAGVNRLGCSDRQPRGIGDGYHGRDGPRATIRDRRERFLRDRARLMREADVPGDDRRSGPGPSLPGLKGYRTSDRSGTGEPGEACRRVSGGLSGQATVLRSDWRHGRSAAPARISPLPNLNRTGARPAKEKTGGHDRGPDHRQPDCPRPR